MRAKLLDPKFVYKTAQESMKPGYLDARFKNEYKPKPEPKHEVVPLKRVGK